MPKFIQIAVGPGENALFALDDIGRVWRRIHCAECGPFWQEETHLHGHDQEKHKREAPQSN